MTIHYFIRHPREGASISRPLYYGTFPGWITAFAGMTQLGVIFMIFLFATMATAHAAQPNEMLSDPKLEARARDISQDLRCLVCQNQSIDDSDAPLAHDLRVLLRQRLVAGDTDEGTKQYIVARYGDYVLLKPPLKPSTVLLWFGPLALLLAAIACTLSFYRAREKTGPLPLTEQERQRLATLTSEKNSEPHS